MAKNKIYTPSYFTKRLKDSGYSAYKMFDEFKELDPRRWVVIVNPGYESVVITCYTNKEELHDCIFEINDGGQSVPKNFQLHTKSIEVVINYLRDYGINGWRDRDAEKEEINQERS
jgi:hypothetical protein